MITYVLLTVAMTAMSPIAAGAQTEAPPIARPEDAKICKREAVTGSKARTRRICMTKAQWNDVWSRTRESNAELEARSAGRIGCVNAAAGGVC